MFTIRADLREIRSGIIDTLKQIQAAGSITHSDSFEIIEDVLTVGDYIVQCGDRVLIIERKAVADLAASIIDKRIYENHKKLLDAASNGNLHWRIMYLIEGKQFIPNDASKKVNGVCIANLRAKLDHLMFRDGCQIEWTTCTKHTAERIVEIGKNISSMKSMPPALISKTAGGCEMRQEGNTTDVNAIVKKKYIKNEYQVQTDMLTCINGVGPVIAGSLLKRHTFRKIISGDIDDIQHKKIIDDLKNIWNGSDIITPIKMLAQINGVGEDVARLILNATTIGNFNAAAAAEVCRPNGRRVGHVIAGRIYNTINWENTNMTK